MKEGQTNPTCPQGYYVSKNNSNKCCKGKQNWYVSTNNKDPKCCKNENRYERNGLCLNLVTRTPDGASVNLKNTTTNSSQILPITCDINDKKCVTYKEIDTNKDNKLDYNELYTWVSNTYGPAEADLYKNDNRFAQSDKNKDGSVTYDEFNF